MMQLSHPSEMIYCVALIMLQYLLLKTGNISIRRKKKLFQKDHQAHLVNLCLTKFDISNQHSLSEKEQKNNNNLRRVEHLFTTLWTKRYMGWISGAGGSVRLCCVSRAHK